MSMGPTFWEMLPEKRTQRTCKLGQALKCLHGDNGKENENYRDDGDFIGFIQGYWGLYRVYTGILGII